MIGLDTNVLVRYIMQDDAKQSPAATRLLESLTADAPGFIPLVAIVELIWVLSAAYDLQRPQMVQVLETLLRTKELVIDRGEIVWKALRQFQSSSGDFADCLIACSAESAGCEQTLTFDRGAARLSGMRLLAV